MQGVWVCLAQCRSVPPSGLGEARGYQADSRRRSRDKSYGRGSLLSNLREPFASTSIAGLGWDENREKAIDRVAAAGKASELGVNLWKARYMLEVKAYQSTREGLVALYRERYRREEPRLVASVIDQCLHEFLSPFCGSCNGAKEMMAGDLKVTCQSCSGTGVRRYGNEERARAMKISFGLLKRMEHKFKWLLGEMQGLDRDVNKVLADQLERD